MPSYQHIPSSTRSTPWGYFSGDWQLKISMLPLGLFPDTSICELPIRRECRESFPHHWVQRKSLVSDSNMHHGTCVTHVPWCMSGSLTCGGENVPGIPGACATRNFMYLAGGQCDCPSTNEATPKSVGKLTTWVRALQYDQSRTNELHVLFRAYLQISNTRRTKSPNLNVSRLVSFLSLPNLWKPGVKSRMKI